MAVQEKTKEVMSVEADLALVNALWGGTRTMRDAGRTYLPQEKGEEAEDYKNRKDRSTLTNIFKKTVNGYAGRLFTEHVSIANQVGLESFQENVDLEGRDLHRFSYDLARMTIRDGLRFILIDAPKSEDAKTKKDEMALGIRPYFVEIDRRNVLGWKTKIIGANKVFTQFRTMENVSEGGDEFTQSQVAQIRVIEPLQIRLYRQASDGSWTLRETIDTSVNYVPVVPVFSDRQGFMLSPPPLLDLAWLNIEHWQKSSDQSNILHVARVPILHWAGYKPGYDSDGKEVELTIGPNSLAKSSDPKAKLEYVEHSGEAIGSGRADILDLESRMVAMGAEFTAPQKSGDITATEKAINESGDISELSAFAQNLKDSLGMAVMMAADMSSVKFTGEITLNTKLGIMTTPVNTEQIVKLRVNGDISREGAFEVLNDEWGTTLDAVIEADRLSSEMPSIGGGGGIFE